MNTRRDFLLTAPLLAMAPALSEAATAHPSPPYVFDRQRFNTILAKPAKHKQCFGSTYGGDVLYQMNNSIGAYDDFLQEGPGSMHAVAVFYHGAAVLVAMNDAFWNDVLVPYVDKSGLRAAYPDVERGKGNPYLHSAPNGASIESLAAKGSSFFVCHNAIQGFSGEIARGLNERRSAVYAAMMAAIVPAALVVPAGVMAINACQEAKFTYIQATL